MTAVAEPVADASRSGRGRASAWIAAHAVDVLAATIAVLPILVAVVRALANHYVPIGDDGLILLRSRDVFTANHPWLGTWSSSSLSLGVALNNPGPLLFDLMALPTKVLGAGPGLAIGVGLLNAGCLVGAAAVAFRIGGRAAFLVVLFVGSVLAWSMGSALLIDVWQPHVLVFPFLLLLVVSWALASGHVWALPGAVALASLLVQTHLSYVFIAPIALLAGTGIYLGSTRGWRRLVRPVVWSLPVALVLWAQPLWQQVHGPGSSNIDRLVDAASGKYGDSTAIGLKVAVRLTSAVVAMPPALLRPSFADTIPSPRLSVPLEDRFPAGVPTLLPAIVSLTIVLGLMFVIIHRSKRDLRPGAREAAWLAAVLVVAGAACLAVMPVGVLGISPHQMRWLWPIGALVLIALLMGAFARSTKLSTVSAVLLAALTAVSALNVPGYEVPAGTVAYSDATSSVRSLVHQVPALRGSGVLLFDPSTLRFGEPYSGPLLAALADAGIPFVTRDEGFVHQLGEGRRATGCGAAQGVRDRMTIVTGPDAYETPPGSTRALFVPGLDRAQRREFELLGSRLRSVDVPFDIYGVPHDVPPALRSVGERYLALQRARELRSVAVLLTPNQC